MLQLRVFGTASLMSEVTRRGFVCLPADGSGAAHEGVTPPFVVTASGELTVVTAGSSPPDAAGDTRVCLTGAS